MNIVGIDVGIKTLSICVLNKNDILLWDVCNILDDEVLCIVCGRKAKYVDNHCGTHYSGIKAKKFEIKKKKVKNYNLQEICTAVINKINFFFEENVETFSSIRNVVIELQPKFNPKMCFVSNVIFTLFCELYNGTETVVKFDRAKNKLKNYCGDKGEFVKNTYKNRKDKSIEYVTNELVKYSDIWVEWFNNLKKTDDASDSFLLAFNSL
jgi:hypothetical protein